MTEPTHPTPPRFADRALTALWLLNIIVLVATVAWILFDPFAARALGGAQSDSPPPPMQWLLTRCVIASASLSLLALALGLFLGPPAHRTLRSWLALTALIALWLGLLASWQEFAWAGQRWRLGRQLTPFQTLAKTLHDDWPTDDASLPGLGQFSAYPLGNPRTLLVNAQDAGRAAAPIALVHRSEDGDRGALLFRLAGDETGAWLEWHPAGTQPASFIDGLAERHTLDRASPLGDGWHLVRYR